MKRASTFRNSGTYVNGAKQNFAINRTYCDNHIIEQAVYFCSNLHQYWCKKCHDELGREKVDIIDFIDNKISEFYIKWADLKDKIIQVGIGY